MDECTHREEEGQTIEGQIEITKIKQIQTVQI